MVGGDCGALGSEPIMFSGVPTAAGWVVLEPWGGGRGADAAWTERRRINLINRAAGVPSFVPGEGVER